MPDRARFPGPTPLTPLAHADLSYSNPVDIHLWEKDGIKIEFVTFVALGHYCYIYVTVAKAQGSYLNTLQKLKIGNGEN